MKNAEKSQSRTRSWIHLFVSALVTAALLIAMFWEKSPAELFSMLLEVPREVFLLYGAMALLALIVRAKRALLILRHMLPGKLTVGMWQLLVVTAVRNALVDLFPARLGELSYLYLLRRYKVPLSAGISSFGVGFLLDIAVLILLLLGLLLIPLGSYSIALPSWSKLTLLVISASIVVALWKASFVLDWCEAKTVRFKNYFPKESRGKRAAAAIQKLLHDWKEQMAELARAGFYAELLFLTFALRVLKYASLYVLFLGFSRPWGVGPAEVPPIGGVFAFITAEATASLPASGLMGFGVYEGAWSGMIAFLCGKGCEALPMLEVAFLIHLSTQILGYSLGILGGACFLLGELRRGMPGQA